MKFPSDSDIEVQQLISRYNHAVNGRQRKKQFKFLMNELDKHPVIRFGDAVLLNPTYYSELKSRVEELESSLGLPNVNSL